MQHEGGFHLGNVRHIINDKALRTVMDLKVILKASSLGGWLRKAAADPVSVKACTEVNKVFCNQPCIPCSDELVQTLKRTICIFRCAPCHSISLL